MGQKTYFGATLQIFFRERKNLKGSIVKETEKTMV